MNNYYIRQDAIENNSIESEKLNCLVTSVSASSTDAEVPTAKCLYDITIGRDDFIVTATYNNNDNTYSVDHSAYEVILATRGGKKAYLKYENVYYPASFISGTENSSRVIYSSVFGDISDNNLSNIRIVRYNHKGTTLTYDSSIIPTLDDLSKKQDKNFIVTTNLEGTLADQSSEAVNQQYNLGKNIYLNFLGETLIPLVSSSPGYSVYSTIVGSIVNDSYNDKILDNPIIITILQEDTSLTFDHRLFSDVAFSGSYESLTDVPDLSLKEDKNNKVNSITSQSEDSQYPSAKAVYELVNGHDYSLDYLTFIAKSDGSFKFTGRINEEENINNTISYSSDNGQSWAQLQNVVTIDVTEGDIVLWKGEMKPDFEDEEGIGSFNGSTAQFNVQGNPLSLIYGDDFRSYDGPKSYSFMNLFESTSVISTKNLFLSAKLNKYCYSHMFYNCTSLVETPKLFALALKERCYSSMFLGCTSLTITPELPATTLADSCYSNMFTGCTSLTTPPELPATSLNSGCYSGMFTNCTSLIKAPELPATTVYRMSYYSMFHNCTSLTTPPQLPATTLARECYREMFLGCTSLTTAPRLSTATLVLSCYFGMFRDCASLTTPPELPATTLAIGCYKEMFYGCTSLTTAPELLATLLYYECYSRMFRGCINLKYIKMLAIATPSQNIRLGDCIGSWIYEGSDTGIFIKNAALDDLIIDEYDLPVPEGWQVYTEEEYELVRLYQLNNKENTSNKVISISSSSTDDQYPSAKCVYDLIGNIENLLNEL